MRDVSRCDTLKFFTPFPLIGQQVYLPIWQIKVLHTHSIIRLTRISVSIVWNVDGVTKFFFLLFLISFYSDHFSMKALDRIESEQSSVNG